MCPRLRRRSRNPWAAVLQVAPEVTTVTVGLEPGEIATEQLHQELKQRVLGVIPNYYVTYESHPAPLSPAQKFHLSLKMLVDPATFAAAGITAGIQQSMNSYHQYGQGAEGYAKRFGAAYGTGAQNLLITAVVADSVLHQDPRYFYSGQGTKAQRARYAVESAFRTKGGQRKVAAAVFRPDWVGCFGGTCKYLLPGLETQYTLLGRSLMFHFAGLVALNLGQEFFLKRVTSHTPKLQSAENRTVLREGTPVPMIAVEGFGAGGSENRWKRSLFVLAEDLTVGGKVFGKDRRRCLRDRLGQVSLG